MANNERLTKRVKKMEEWIAENGSGPTLDNFNWLVEIIRGNDMRMRDMENNFNAFNKLFQEYMTEHELLEDWNKWLEEKDNAIQKQQTEEVSVQEEAEGSEEAISAPKDEEEE